MPAPRRPWQPREDVTARRARIRSVSRGASVAVLVLVLATAGSVVGIVTSNRQHGVAAAAAAALNPIGSASSGSIGGSSGPGSGSSAKPGSSSSVIIPGTVLPIAATTKPVSQGQPGVIPVPLAPRAVAGPIPLLAWQAYHRAAASSGCKLPWYLLAGIGKIESNHGRFGGARYDVGGTVHPAIYGPPTAYGRAMGPMQFIPPTWASYATDGNGDGVADPQNVFDATEAAAHYLCNAGGPDLSGAAAQRRAVFAYNHLDSYVADVLAFAAAYQHGQPESSVPLVPISNPKPAPTTTSATRTSNPTTTTTTTSTSTATSGSAPTTPATPTSATSPTGSSTPTGPGGTCSTTPSIPTTTPTKTTPTKTTPTKTTPTNTTPTKTTPTSTSPTTSRTRSPSPSSSGSAPTCPVCPTPTAPASTTSTSSPPTCPPSPTPSGATGHKAARSS